MIGDGVTSNEQGIWCAGRRDSRYLEVVSLDAERSLVFSEAGRRAIGS